MPVRLGSGRKSDCMWSEVNKIDGLDNVECKYCKAKISSRIQRIRLHLNKCEKKRKFTVNVNDSDDGKSLRSPFRAAGPSTSFRSSTPKKAHSSSFPSASGDSELDITHDISDISKTGAVATFTSDSVLKPPAKKQKSMEFYASSTSNSQKSIIDLQLAKFFFSANIPFCNVENEEFKKLIQMLRISYVPPNRKKLGSELLEKVDTEVKDLMRSIMSESVVTLLQDGWSNVKNDPIIAHSIHNGETPYLLCITDAGSEKKTAEYCAELVKNAIVEIKESYNKEVFAVCTDNENKMNKMKELLKLEYPKLLTYGCSAHYLNLVEKDVTPKTILKHLIEVNKYFRQHHQAHGWLMEKGGTMPQLPNETRWNSQIDCVNSYITNHPFYVEIRGDNQATIQDNVGKIIDNIQIFREAKNLQSQLIVVGNALDQLQSDSTTISYAVAIWLSLLENELIKPFHADIKRRFEKACQHLHFVAYITDIRYLNDKKLSVEQEDIAEEWLISLYPEFINGLIAFKLKDKTIFPEHMLSSNYTTVKPKDWWKLIEERESRLTQPKLPDGFATFCRSLHCCPASSGSIERIFSTFGVVWSKLRNSLGKEKAEKLVRVYRHFRSDHQDQDW